MTTTLTASSNALFWNAQPLILASKSAGRARLLRNAGISFAAVDSGLDERAVAFAESATPMERAKTLALAKARAASISHTNQIVIGADQILALGDVILHKSKSREQAIAQLKAMRGCAHELHSAVAVIANGETSFLHGETARIHMRDIDDTTLEDYADAMGPALHDTVGGYEIEGLGAGLMERIEGDYFTIVGLPLLALLGHLQNAGLLRTKGNVR